MLSARVRIFHIRCLVDFARTYLMAYLLRRRLYILNTERQDRSSVVERDWPKDNSCVQKIAKPGKAMDLHRQPLIVLAFVLFLLEIAAR
jgi:hypothetical protein